MKLDYYCFTNKGGRSKNEDSIGVREYVNGAVFVVADGLGGHSSGELASACAVDAVLDVFDEAKCGVEEKIMAAAKQANESILELQRENNTTMKSTLAIAALENNRAVIANTGDSRVYYFHNNEISLYTQDHSVAYKKYKAREITRDMLATDEDQSSLLRVLGNVDRYEPDIIPIENELAPGDAFVLCSDGAWEYIKDEEMLIDQHKCNDAKRWAELMLVRAMERINGDNDNLSLITVMIND